MPGVEANLHDIVDESERAVTRRTLVCQPPLGLDDLGYFPLQSLHEARFSRTPLAEDADGQRRLGLLEADEPGKGAHIRGDPQRVAGADRDAVGGEAGKSEHRKRRRRRIPPDFAPRLDILLCSIEFIDVQLLVRRNMLKEALGKLTEVDAEFRARRYQDVLVRAVWISQNHGGDEV